MREKNIYRRYLSIAMTAVMTIQLCAPTEAVWGAAAHKKVKIITEFAELPESVRQMQIPAGVEETELEQYLQFPERWKPMSWKDIRKQAVLTEKKQRIAMRRPGKMQKQRRRRMPGTQ